MYGQKVPYSIKILYPFFHGMWLFLRTALNSLKVKSLNLAHDAFASDLVQNLGASEFFLLEKDYFRLIDGLFA